MKQKTKELVLIKSGDYMLDMSKLVFGGIVLVVITQLENLSNITLLLFGIIAVVISAICGIILTSISQINKKKGA
jgi:hypothetical protein